MEGMSTIKLFAICIVSLICLTMIISGAGVLLMSCATPAAPPHVTTGAVFQEGEVMTIAEGTFPDGLHLVVVDQAGLACVVVKYYRSTGVSCVPLSQTTLEGGGR